MTANLFFKMQKWDSRETWKHSALNDGECESISLSNASVLSSASRVAQLVKNRPAVRETWLPSLGQEDPLEKGKTTHSSALAESDTTEQLSLPLCALKIWQKLRICFTIGPKTKNTKGRSKGVWHSSRTFPLMKTACVLSERTRTANEG